MIYTCVRCGAQFEAKHKTAVCSNCHTAVCVVCGKEFELQTPWTQQTCSAVCRGIYRKQSGIARKATAKARETVKSKYGVANPQQLQQFVKICKYCGKEFITSHARQIYCNDDHYGPCPVCGKPVKIKEMYLGPQACSDKCRVARIQTTCLEKYGDPNAVNSTHARELSKQHCLEKYGVDHYSKTDEYRDKFTHTMLTRYGTTVPLHNRDILAKLRQTCEARYGVAYNCMRPECRSSYRTISKINLAFGDLLSANSIDFEMEFALNRYSYDFKIAKNLVEVDPSITHNTMMSIFPDMDPLDPNYHKNKSDLAAQNGYRCIHVFDWDDWNKIVDLVRPCVDIFARKCKLEQIDTKTADRFTAMYHISGRCNGQKLNYGLYYDGELVEVMTFGKPRYNAKYDFELLRLCSKSGVRVVGGASKLFAQFRKDNPEATVISYCDLSKFSGAVYEKIGMQILNYTAPNKVWSKNNKKITQNLLNQRGYDQLFHTNFGKGTSNEQLMLDNGWLPVYDCGQAVYVI